MRREDWKKEAHRGMMLVSSGDRSASVEIPLGHGSGRLHLIVGFPDFDGDRVHANFQLRWDDRPGDPVSVSPDPWFGKDYLAHARINIRTGEIEPGYQIDVDDDERAEQPAAQKRIGA